ncbi:hypothetical protein Tco_0322688 [Tanacetum coccineum]
MFGGLRGLSTDRVALDEYMGVWFRSEVSEAVEVCSMGISFCTELQEKIASRRQQHLEKKTAVSDGFPIETAVSDGFPTENSRRYRPAIVVVTSGWLMRLNRDQEDDVSLLGLLDTFLHRMYEIVRKTEKDFIQILYRVDGDDFVENYGNLWLFALPTPPPSPLTPLSSPLPQIPSPPTHHPLPLLASSLAAELKYPRQPRSIVARIVDHGFVYTLDTSIHASEEKAMAADDHAALRDECQDADDRDTEHIMHIQALEAGSRVDILEDTDSSA